MFVEVLKAMSELRTHKRVRVNMKVAYRNNDQVYKMGRVYDISKGGMYVQTSNTPDVDGYVIASLDAEAFGKVIWVQGQCRLENPHRHGYQVYECR